METLRDSDWRAGFELLGRVIEAGPGLAGMTQAMVRALPRLVASELTTLSICDLASGRRRVIGVPDGVLSRGQLFGQLGALLCGQKEHARTRVGDGFLPALVGL